MNTVIKIVLFGLIAIVVSLISGLIISKTISDSIVIQGASVLLTIFDRGVRRTSVFQRTEQ